jgi:hypothetical protein
MSDNPFLYDPENPFAPRPPQRSQTPLRDQLAKVGKVAKGTAKLAQGMWVNAPEIVDQATRGFGEGVLNTLSLPAYLTPQQIRDPYLAGIEKVRERGRDVFGMPETGYGVGGAMAGDMADVIGRYKLASKGLQIAAKQTSKKAAAGSAKKKAADAVLNPKSRAGQAGLDIAAGLPTDILPALVNPEYSLTALHELPWLQENKPELTKFLEGASGSPVKRAAIDAAFGTGIAGTMHAVPAAVQAARNLTGKKPPAVTVTPDIPDVPVAPRAPEAPAMPPMSQALDIAPEAPAIGPVGSRKEPVKFGDGTLAYRTKKGWMTKGRRSPDWKQVAPEDQHLYDTQYTKTRPAPQAAAVEAPAPEPKALVQEATPVSQAPTEGPDWESILAQMPDGPIKQQVQSLLAPATPQAAAPIVPPVAQQAPAPKGRKPKVVQRVEQQPAPVQAPPAPQAVLGPKETHPPTLTLGNKSFMLEAVDKEGNALYVYLSDRTGKREYRLRKADGQEAPWTQYTKKRGRESDPDKTATVPKPAPVGKWNYNDAGPTPGLEAAVPPPAPKQAREARALSQAPPPTSSGETVREAVERAAATGDMELLAKAEAQIAPETRGHLASWLDDARARAAANQKVKLEEWAGGEVRADPPTAKAPPRVPAAREAVEAAAREFSDEEVHKGYQAINRHIAKMKSEGMHVDPKGRTLEDLELQRDVLTAEHRKRNPQAAPAAAPLRSEPTTEEVVTEADRAARVQAAKQQPRPEPTPEMPTDQPQTFRPDKPLETMGIRQLEEQKRRLESRRVWHLTKDTDPERTEAAARVQQDIYLIEDWIARRRKLAVETPKQESAPTKGKAGEADKPNSTEASIEKAEIEREVKRRAAAASEPEVAKVTSEPVKEGDLTGTKVLIKNNVVGRKKIRGEVIGPKRTPVGGQAGVQYWEVRHAGGDVKLYPQTMLEAAPPPREGSVDKGVLSTMAGGAAGGAIGAAVDDEDPIRGALTGLLAGSVTANVAAKVIRDGLKNRGGFASWASNWAALDKFDDGEILDFIRRMEKAGEQDVADELRSYRAHMAAWEEGHFKRGGADTPPGGESSFWEAMQALDAGEYDVVANFFRTASPKDQQTLYDTAVAMFEGRGRHARREMDAAGLGRLVRRMEADDDLATGAAQLDELAGTPSSLKDELVPEFDETRAGRRSETGPNRELKSQEDISLLHSMGKVNTIIENAMKRGHLRPEESEEIWRVFNELPMDDQFSVHSRLAEAVQRTKDDSFRDLAYQMAEAGDEQGMGAHGALRQMDDDVDDWVESADEYGKGWDPDDEAREIAELDAMDGFDEPYLRGADESEGDDFFQRFDRDEAVGELIEESGGSLRGDERTYAFRDAATEVRDTGKIPKGFSRLARDAYIQADDASKASILRQLRDLAERARQGEGPSRVQDAKHLERIAKTLEHNRQGFGHKGLVAPVASAVAGSVLGAKVDEGNPGRGALIGALLVGGVAGTPRKFRDISLEAAATASASVVALNETDMTNAAGWSMLAGAGAMAMLHRTKAGKLLSKPTGKIWGAAESTHQAAADYTWKRFPKIGHAFFTGHESGEAMKLMRRSLKHELSFGEKLARQIEADIAKLPKLADERISRAIDDAADPDEFLKALEAEGFSKKDAQAAVDVLADINHWFGVYGKGLADLGLLTHSTIAKRAGAYAPFLYKQLEDVVDSTNNFQKKSKAIRLRGLGRLMERKGSEVLTPIESASLRTATGIVEEAYLVGAERFFQAAYGNDDWTHVAFRDNHLALQKAKKTQRGLTAAINKIKAELDPYKQASRKYGTGMLGADPKARKRLKNLIADRKELDTEIGKLTRKSELLGKEAKAQGYVQMGTSGNKSLGSMAGMYMKDNIAKEINGVDELKVLHGTFIDGYDKWLRRWKTAKTAYNPATHGRNILAAQLLGWMGDGPAPFGEYFFRAQKAVRKSRITKDGFVTDSGDKALDALFDEANKLGLLDGGFFLDDLQARQSDKLTAKVKSKLERAHHTITSIYGKEDQWARLAYFMDAVERRGLPAAEAADLARQWVPTYEGLSNATRQWARWGPPFFAYTAAAFPRVAEAAVSNPLRFQMVGMAAAGMGYVLFDDELPEEVLPRDMRGVASDLPLPSKVKTAARRIAPTYIPSRKDDKQGRRPYLDMTYIMPYGDIAEGRGRGNAWMDRLPGNMNPFSNPLFGSAATIFGNRDSFTDQALIDRGMSPGEQSFATTDYLYKEAMPSLAPAIPGVTKGGWNYQKLRDAGVLPSYMEGKGVGFHQRPNYRGETRPRGRTVADAIGGVKQREVVPALEFQRRLKDIEQTVRAINKDIAEKQRDPNMSAAAKESYRRRKKAQADKLIAEGRALYEKRHTVPTLRRPQ